MEATRVGIIALELAIERIVRIAASPGLQPEQRDPVRERIAALRAKLEDRQPRAPETREGPDTALPAGLAATGRELELALRTLADACGDERGDTDAGKKREADGNGDGGQSPSGPIWQNPVLRQAVQVTLSVGLSIELGTLISAQRWYWAAIAAFIVGLGVGSRGEALTKALQRVGGTIAGLVVGIFLARAVSGQRTWPLP